MTRSVKQIDRVAGVIELENGGSDGDPALFLQLHPVRCDFALFASCFHSTGLLNGTAVKQQLLCERCFTSVRVRNDREIATTCHRIEQLTSILKC